MASYQLTLLPPTPPHNSPATFVLNPFCRQGHNVNHSCRQCLKRTLERWGIDADAYDAEAMKASGKRHAREHRRRWQSDPEIQLEKRLVIYSLTVKEFRDMLRRQHEQCAICHRPISPDTLHVDHNHDTGAVRGLLCRSCNHGLHYIERYGLQWVDNAWSYLHTAPLVQRPAYHGVPLRTRATPQDVQEITRLRGLGYPWTEIVALVGITSGALLAVRRLGLLEDSPCSTRPVLCPSP